MSRPGWEPLPNEDSLLLDYARRLNKFRDGRQAVRLFLSRLRPHHRREQHLRIAASTFDTVIRKFDGALFQLYNKDLVVVCNGANVSDIDECVLRLRYLFSDDPLFIGDEAEGERFTDWYDLEQDYPQFLAHAEQNAAERIRYDAEQAERENAEGDNQSPDLPPLDAISLGSLINSIQNADLTGMLRRQPICAVVGSERPHTLFNELYFAIDALGQLLMPGHDLLANRWLFRELCSHLDRRMMVLLSRREDDVLNRAFSVNLSLDTLLMPAFLEFDNALNSATRRTIVIELQLLDVMADIGRYLFAREFLRDRGYRTCLDGVNCYSLPIIDREAFGVDLVKLEWNVEMADHLNGGNGTAFNQSLQSLTPDRLILCRCDSEQALDFGQAAGVTLFQGFHVNHLLKQRATRQDTIQAMAEARSRQRAAERSVGRAS